MKKPNAKYLLLIVTAVLLVMAVGVSVGRESRKEETVDSDSCTVVKDFVWDMGTEKERQVQILYNPEDGNYWKKGEDSALYAFSEYSGSRKPAMEFSFAEEAGGQIFDSHDTGVAEISHGKVRDACGGYAFLQEQGYRNRYTVRNGMSVDIYLEKDGQYYRYLVVPEAGQTWCTVTFAQIQKDVWEKVLKRGGV